MTPRSLPPRALRLGVALLLLLVLVPTALAAPSRTPTRPRLASSRLELIVGLQAPSLARYAHAQRTLRGFAGRGRRLSGSALASRLYLARLAREQAVVAARIRRAIPSARITWRYRYTLNALAVEVPAAQAVRLGALPGVARLYPNVRYRALTDTVPGLLGVPALWGAAPALPGAGEGVKIGIIDDGIDPSNPFFDPAGYSPPPGFPRGVTRLTTSKVIVARAFAPPNAEASSKLPFDPKVSEHGTHVSGIAAGNWGTTATPGGGLPVLPNLSGVAPRAYLGNYRALTVFDPLTESAVGGTAEIAAAVEKAVEDGMDVLNLSLGGVETDPRSDALVGAVEGAVDAGIVVAIAAGNSYEELGPGSVGSPGSAPDAITVAATTTSRFFGVRGTVLGPGAVPVPLQSFTAAASKTPRIPASFAAPQSIVDSTVAMPQNRDLCGRISARPLAGRLVLTDRGGCTFALKANHAKQAGAVGVVLRDTVVGDPFIIEQQLDVPVAFVTRAVGDALRGFLASAGGQAQLTIGRAVAEVPTVPKVLASFSSSGPTPFTRALKPDVAAPGVSILSSVPNADKDFPGPFAVFDGTSMASPAVAGAAAMLRQLHPTWAPADVKSALMSTAGPGYPDASQAAEASPLREGAGFVNVPAASDPGVVTAPSSVDFGLVSGARGGTSATTVAIRDLGAPGRWAVAVAPQPGAPPGVQVNAPPSVDVPAGGVAALPLTLSVPAGAREADVGGFLLLSQGTRVRRVPYWGLVERPGLAALAPRQLPRPGTYTGDTRQGRSAATTYRYPADPSGSNLPSRYRGPEQLWHFRVQKRALNAGVTVEGSSARGPLPLLLSGRDENTLAGEAGLPLDVGPISFTAGQPEPAAGLWFVQPGDYYVAVDSATAAGAGPYRLRFWVNDLRPPAVKLLTPVVKSRAGALLRFSIADAGSGVDPATVVAFAGSVPLPLPYAVSAETATLRLGRIKPGSYRVGVLAADYAQSKDVLGFSPTTANTVFKVFGFKVIKPPAQKLALGAP